MIDIDLRSRLPIYEQLVEKIKELIVKGVLKSDEQLPSVRSLASETMVNPNTIQKAYRELERQGYLYTVKGKGNFVSSDTTYISNDEKENIKKEIEKNIREGAFLGIEKNELVDIIERIYS